MKFDFKINHRPERFHKGADAVSRLPQKKSGSTEVVADASKDIPTYCIVEQTSKSHTAPEKKENEAGPLPTTKELMAVRAKDMLWQNHNVIMR